MVILIEWEELVDKLIVAVVEGVVMIQEENEIMTSHGYHLNKSRKTKKQRHLQSHYMVKAALDQIQI